MVGLAMVESGLVTLAKILGVLLLGCSLIPLIFLFAPGDLTEPKESFDEH